MGTLPSDIGLLTNLEMLLLQNNNLAGSLPTELGALLKLTMLGLNFNSFSGLIPSEIGGIGALTYLSLQNNMLTGSVPLSFCALPSFVSLSVTANSVTCFPACLITNMAFIRDPLCQQCVYPPDPTPTTTWLISLTIQGNGVSNPTPQILLSVKRSLAAALQLPTKYFSTPVVTPSPLLRRLLVSESSSPPPLRGPSNQRELLDTLYLKITASIPTALLGPYVQPSMTAAAATFQALFLQLTGLIVTVTFQITVVAPRVLESPSSLPIGTVVAIAVGSAVFAVFLLSVAVCYYKAYQKNLYDYRVGPIESGRSLGLPHIIHPPPQPTVQSNLQGNIEMSDIDMCFAAANFSVKKIRWESLVPISIIGEGAFSVVVRAKDASRRREVEVAVKIFKNLAGVRNEELDERIRSEFLAASRAQDDTNGNTNTMRVLGVTGTNQGLSHDWRSKLEAKSPGFGSLQTYKALVARFESGGTLRRLLHETRCVLSMEEKIRILHEVANGVDHLHRCDGGTIVHGDLKSENILFSEGERNSVRLIDFGLATFRERLHQNSTYQGSVAVRGTPGGTKLYMAPEMELESITNDRKTDMWAFGTVCWEVLTGREPWESYKSKTGAHLATAIKSGETLDYSLLPLDTPLDVVQLIKGCLSLDREVRPTSKDALAVLGQAYEVIKEKKFDIFISYAWGPPKKKKFLASKQPAVSYPRAQLVLQIYKELRALGYRPWLDVYEMGNDLKESMRNGIANSKCVVVLFSPDYATRPNCKFELDIAVEHKADGKPIFTCMLCKADKEIWPYLNLDASSPGARPEIAEVCGPGKLAIKGQLFADFSAALGVDWGAQPPRPADRRALLDDSIGLRTLQKMLKDGGVKPSNVNVTISPEVAEDPTQERLDEVLERQESDEFGNQGNPLGSAE